MIWFGSGPAFCLGSDLREVGALQGGAAQRYVQLDFATKNAVAGSTTPVIAAIQGHCIGAGVELALARDRRIAAPDAIVRFRAVPLGAVPGSAGLRRLPAVGGRGVATRALHMACHATHEIDAMPRPAAASPGLTRRSMMTSLSEQR